MDCLFVLTGTVESLSNGVILRGPYPPNEGIIYAVEPSVERIVVFELKCFIRTLSVYIS